MRQPILETLFDSPVKVKLLKLFLRNRGKYFHSSEITQKTQAESREVNHELEKLLAIGFLLKKTQRKTKEAKGGAYYGANQDFDFYQELSNLVLKSSPASKEKILERVQGMGRIKLLLLGGIFLATDNSRVDMFIVGDNIDERKMNNFLKDLESEVGKEIGFAAMTTKEFYYRYQMFDRFVHDILEKPNEKIIDKLRV